MNVLCTFKIKIESQNSDHGFIKNLWLYPNLDQNAKPQSWTFSLLHSPKWGLTGDVCSLHLQNQDRELKFGKLVSYDRLLYPNQDQGAKLQLGKPASSKAPCEDLKDFDVLFTISHQDTEPKFGKLLHERSVTISNTISRFQTPARNPQHVPKPKKRTSRTWMFFAKIWILGVSNTSDHIEM